RCYCAFPEIHLYWSTLLTVVPPHPNHTYKVKRVVFKKIIMASSRILVYFWMYFDLRSHYISLQYLDFLIQSTCLLSQLLMPFFWMFPCVLEPHLPSFYLEVPYFAFFLESFSNPIIFFPMYLHLLHSCLFPCSFSGIPGLTSDTEPWQHRNTAMENILHIPRQIWGMMLLMPKSVQCKSKRLVCPIFSRFSKSFTVFKVCSKNLQKLLRHTQIESQWNSSAEILLLFFAVCHPSLLVLHFSFISDIVPVPLYYLPHFRQSDGKLGMEEYAVFYPPNGMNDTIASSSGIAPLCFLYHEPSKLYQIFREMYVRFFFRLHSISSHPSGIVSLCLLFETLLQTHLPQLFYHLREIGAQPLRISFKWMVRAFSGYLATDQLLLLWDRILGYNSLEILAVLAAAVFAFRAVNLMEVTSLAAAEAVLADLSTLKVMPLLQIFLFATVT
ncbi:TBC19 protein, partial [Zosterops hypoxanthus]|nr:TBC19 protein [Zosterops hypoxanthus]